jgi:hypothetical protein
MAFQILSDVSKQYLLEEDAIKGFRMAVENGQSRLALSILTDIIDVFNGIFTDFYSDEEEQKEVKDVEPKNEKKIETQIKTETKTEEKEPDQKTVVKKETKATEEK